MKILRIGIAACCLAVATSNSPGQGDLVPPGPPEPLMKTLEQVEPRIDLATVEGGGGSEIEIFDSGSYYLSGNLKVEKLWGILVSAEDVTLDLNGFKVVRTGGTGGSGIHLDSLANRVTVRNGSMVGFDQGIWCTSEGCHFEKLTVTGCGVNGIFAGTSSRIVDCRALHNPGTGIATMNGSVLTGCAAYYNEGQGIFAGAGSTLSDCAASNNRGTHGIQVNEKVILENCNANDNLGIGIEAGDGSSLSGCVAGGNTGTGFLVGDGATLEGCTVIRNLGSYGLQTGRGASLVGCAAHSNECVSAISVGPGSSLDRCTASGNRTSAVSNSSGIKAGAGSVLRRCAANGNIASTPRSSGIQALGGCAVLGCTASDNTTTHAGGSSSGGVGIYVVNWVKIQDCVASGNQGSGIEMGRGCAATGNQCSENRHGINVWLDGHRLDGNNVTSNATYGIHVSDPGNIIVRNTARGNATNYLVAAGNDLGTIRTTPVGAGAWDNFEF